MPKQPQSETRDDEHDEAEEGDEAPAFDPTDPLHVIVQEAHTQVAEVTQIASDTLSDISRTKKRLAREASVELLSSELTGTALSIDASVLAELKKVVKGHADLAMVVLQMRDGAESSFEDVDARISDLENDATRIAPEDGEKLLALVGAASFLVDTLRPLVRGDEKVLARLDEISALIDECDEIVKDGIVEEDDDEPGEGEAPPGDSK